MNHGHKDIDWLSKLHFEEDGVSVPITKVMYLLWRLRGVHEGFQIETEEGRWQYFSWFITFARREFPSLPFSIDDQLIEYLRNRPVMSSKMWFPVLLAVLRRHGKPARICRKRTMWA